ncbi:MAG: phage baseplate assembly protein V [Desulfobacteraceae bacterium]|nr:phage baseplate assembly protein V [Desulfobacteraceae bacterium]
MKPIAALPKIEILIGGRELEKKDLACLGSVRVIQRLSCPSLCEAVFTGVDEGFFDRLPHEKHTPWQIFMAGEALPLFKGVITAAEYRFDPSGTLELYVRGYDRLYFSGKKQRIHTHVQATVPEIAREMLKDYGIEPAPFKTGPVWQQEVQFRETDLEFLTRIAQRSGLYFFVNRQDRLEIMDLSPQGNPVVLTRGDNLFELSLEVNDAPALTSVYASGWDPFLAKFYEAEAAGKEGNGQKRKLADIALKNSAEAEAVCRAELDRCMALETTAKGVAEGNTGLAPGTVVNIEKIPSSLSRKYVLTEVEHTWSADSGYISEFSSAPPDFRKQDCGASATFGIVTDINDPENLGRIKALLPAFENQESHWINVVIPAAGKNKGAVMLPDTGDQVLILFLNNDPARGVVVGGIFGSSQQPTDWGIEGGRVMRFCLVTPGGQKFTLDDEAQGVKIENSKGSFLEINPDKVTLSCKTDLSIKAPGKNITITGNRIDFQKG